MKHLLIEQAFDKQERVSARVVDTLYNMTYEDEYTPEEDKLDETSNLTGHITCKGAYEDAVNYLNGRFGSNDPNVPAKFLIESDTYYIRFKDATAADICINKWGDGTGVSAEQLNKVLTLDHAFHYEGSFEDIINNIVDFPEFQYFTGVTNFGYAIRFENGDPKLNSITMPPTVMYYDSPIIKPGTWKSYAPLKKINWNGATLKFSRDIRYMQGAIKDCGIEYYDGILPNQAELPMIFNGCPLLTKMIYPEGVTRTMDNFTGCNVTYVEFPRTLEKALMLFPEFRRGASAVNDLTGCVVFKSRVPPTFYDDIFTVSSMVNVINTDRSLCKRPAHIYVPDSAVEAYKEALYVDEGVNDSQYKDFISRLVTPISQMTDTERALGTITNEEFNELTAV